MYKQLINVGSMYKQLNVYIYIATPYVSCVCLDSKTAVKMLLNKIFSGVKSVNHVYYSNIPEQ